METQKRKRKRIQQPKKFKAGDVFWAYAINDKYHLTIILEDHTHDNHQECIPFCNFSGTEPNNKLNYIIPINDYKLPEHWWTRANQAKPRNWIICQPKDCIKAKDYSAEAVVGNIKDECPELFNLICDKTQNCLIAPRLKNLCDCENENEIVVDDDEKCECENIPNLNT